MKWEKQLSRRAASEGGWKEDLPLSHDLPDQITIDCCRLQLPIYPLFVIRLRTFLEWHSRHGRSVRLVRPEDSETRRAFDSLDVAAGLDIEVRPRQRQPSSAPTTVLPVTTLHEFMDVEAVAERVREMLEYELTEASALGAASYMAVSELCSNAIEHGSNPSGALVAATSFAAPRRQVSIGIGDLGIGIPEHLRQVFPEWFDDNFAIAQAMQPKISGTGDPHRGNGFNEVFEAALVSAMSSARVDVHSAKGFVRTQFFGGEKKMEPFPAASFRRGTWISFEIVSA